MENENEVKVEAEAIVEEAVAEATPEEVSDCSDSDCQACEA